MDSKAKALKADAAITQWECHKVTLFFPLLYQANLSYYKCRNTNKVKHKKCKTCGHKHCGECDNNIFEKYSQPAMASSQPATASSQPATASSQSTKVLSLEQRAAASLMVLEGQDKTEPETNDAVEYWECHRVTLLFPSLYQANLSYYSASILLKLSIRSVNPVGIDAVGDVTMI